MGAPSISVIIPTRGRDECVRQTLRDLAIQDYADFDIWIVDQNDQSLKDLHKDVGERFLHHELMAPLGSHAGRNHAIFKTQADLCVFVDDDVRLHPHFLSLHAEAMSNAEQDIGAIAGRVIQPRDGYTEQQMQEMGKPARYNRWIGKVTGNFVGSERAFVHHIHECNFSARTAALRKIGGFNEEFRGNAYFEGADLALRLIAAGYKVLYRPDIVLTHLQEGAGGNRVAQKDDHTYWYMRNYGLLNSLHMSALGLPAFTTLGLGYVLAKAVKNQNPEIAIKGLKGLADGLKYFLPGSTRLRCRTRNK